MFPFFWGDISLLTRHDYPTGSLMTTDLDDHRLPKEVRDALELRDPGAYQLAQRHDRADGLTIPKKG